MPDFARYRPLLAEPRFRAQALSGFLAQLSQGGAALALILLIQQTRGSLGLAGAATAGLLAGTAIARPIQGRLIDTHDPRSVLVLIALGHTVALLALIPVAHSELPGVAAVATSLLAGLGLPPVSQTQRLVWADLADEDRTTVYSVIGMIQEASILIGPLLVGVLVGVASPTAAMIAVALISGAGLVWLGLSVPRSSGLSREERAVSPLRARGVRVVLLLEFLFGISLGGIEIGVPALATARGHPSAAGFLIALSCVGGIAGGLIYGARHWSVTPRVRLVVLLSVSAMGFTLLVPIEGLVVAGGVLLVLGMVLTPVLTTLIVMLDLASPQFLAEAFGWSSTSSAVGSGVGAALSGVLAQHHGAGPAFAAAAAACALAVLVAAVAGGPRVPVGDDEGGGRIAVR